MPRAMRLRVLRSILTGGLVPLFHHDDAEVAYQAVSAVAAGGSGLVEFTNRGSRALDTFHELLGRVRTEHPGLLLGAGSITDPVTAALFLNAGADFIVGPTLNPEIATLCHRHKVAYIPGCATATEIGRAEELGCEIVKVFPGDAAGGPGFVKAVLAPSPRSLLMPTGGVDITEESLASWFSAGAAAVGIGSRLISRQLLEGHDWEALTQRVGATMATIRELNYRIRESL